MCTAANVPADRSARSSGRCVWALLLALLCFARAADADEITCGPLTNAFGPFDYRDPEARGEPLHLVESAHFTSDIENLIRGNSGTLGGDLDYTLRAFPNHHRALYSVAKYAMRSGNTLLRPGACYFDRAIRFRPDDAMVYLVQGIYLSQARKFDDSIKSYRRAITLQPGSAEAHYNLGLALLQVNDPAGANEQAQIAYGLGYPFDGLRRRLTKLGAWRAVANADKPAPVSSAPK